MVEWSDASGSSALRCPRTFTFSNLHALKVDCAFSRPTPHELLDGAMCRRSSACGPLPKALLKFESGVLGGGGIVSTSAWPLLVTELRLFCSQIYSSMVQVG